MTNNLYIELINIFFQKKISCQESTGTGTSGTGTGGTGISESGSDGSTSTGAETATGTGAGFDYNSDESDCDGNSYESSEIENFGPNRPGGGGPGGPGGRGGPGGPGGRNGGLSQRRKMKGGRGNSNDSEMISGKFKKRHSQNKKGKNQKLSRPQKDD